MLTVFTLASGRSGTHFLYEIVRRNARDRAARHEPYGLNPSMFGRPIYERASGERAYSRTLLARKARVIGRCGRGTYLETSHAFLKSWSDLAPEFFPNLRLVHLVRDPLKVAKSEAFRETWLHRLRLPLRNYRGGDGRKYFRWALTGKEPIFQHFAATRLSRLQWYLLQWIEIENRAMQFLDQSGLRGNCLTLHSPHELNSVDRVGELFNFLGLQLRRGSLDLHGRQNRNPQPTVITDDDRRELAELIAELPPQYLEIFGRPPYTAFPWAGSLTASTAPPARTRL